MRRKDRPKLLKDRPIRSFLRERSTLIIEKPLLGSRKGVKEEAAEGKRLGFRRLRRPEPSKKVTGFVARARPKSHTHLSYEGQSELSYCVECAQKHSQTAKVLMREAIGRAQVGSPSDPGVLEKVRGAVEELLGFEDDTDTVKNEKIETLNSLGRTLRKFIYAKKAEIGDASLEDLREIKDMLDKLVDASYEVRKSEEWCPGCDVGEICGGNLECIEFMEGAARSVKDPEEWEKFLEEAKRKYGRG